MELELLLALLLLAANDFKLLLLTDNCCKLAVTKELVATCWGCWVVVLLLIVGDVTVDGGGVVTLLR